MIDRRSFIKICAGTMAAISTLFIPSVSQDAVAQIKPEEKHPKDVVCRDFSPQITIHEYDPGKPLKVQDLRMDGDCSMCQYEHACGCGGKEFTKAYSTGEQITYEDLMANYKNRVSKI